MFEKLTVLAETLVVGEVIELDTGDIQAEVLEWCEVLKVKSQKDLFGENDVTYLDVKILFNKQRFTVDSRPKDKVTKRGKWLFSLN